MRFAMHEIKSKLEVISEIAVVNDLARAEVLYQVREILHGLCNQCSASKYTGYSRAFRAMVEVTELQIQGELPTAIDYGETLRQTIAALYAAATTDSPLAAITFPVSLGIVGFDPSVYKNNH